MPSSLGGGAIIALAAVLWLVYLAPSWMRRRQFLSTERTAVRLQQTLRILAETADVPAEVRAEVSARSVAEQHRALRAAARKAEAAARPAEAAAERSIARSHRPAPREPRQRAEAVSALTSRRLRRTRLVAGGVLLASIVLVGIGLTRIGAGDWFALVAGVVGVFGAVAVLQRAATAAAAHRAVVAVDHAVSGGRNVPQSFTDWQRTEQARPTWTPVPIPKPLYLDDDKITPARAAEIAAAAESLRIAAKQADDALRSAHAAAEVASIDVTSTERRAGFAAMGIVDDTGPVLHDLDAVLRRRRAG